MSSQGTLGTLQTSPPPRTAAAASIRIPAGFVLRPGEIAGVAGDGLFAGERNIAAASATRAPMVDIPGSNRWDCWVPTQGMTIRLKPSEPAMAPTVLAA